MCNMHGYSSFEPSTCTNKGDIIVKYSTLFSDYLSNRCDQCIIIAYCVDCTCKNSRKKSVSKTIIIIFYIKIIHDE